jgi:hypothetical protein
MSLNGKRRPRRPSLEVVAPGAGREQTAAIAAALEQFLRDTAPASAPDAPVRSWERAALAEGVGLAAPTPWGDDMCWGAR